jgi:hypothetical protein
MLTQSTIFDYTPLPDAAYPRSDALVIGAHEWRLVYCPSGSTFYEWRRVGDDCWQHHKRWPRYDFNNGMTLGLPVRLRELAALEREKSSARNQFDMFALIGA